MSATGRSLGCCTWVIDGKHHPNCPNACHVCGDTGFVVYNANPHGERRMADADCPRGCPDYRTGKQPLEASDE